MIKQRIVGALLCSLCVLSSCSDTPEQNWELATQGTYSISLSDGGEYALVGSILHGGSLWRLGDNERIFNWNHDQNGYSNLVASAFSPNNTHALTADKKRLVMWNIKNGEAEGFWQANGGATSVTLSQDGLFALVGQANYSVLFIDTASGSVLARLPHEDSVGTVAISGNGRLGITGDADGLVRIWDLTKPKEIHRFNLGADITKVALSLNGRAAFASANYGKGHLWDVKTGKELAKLGGTRVTLSAARFNKNGTQLLTGDNVRRTILWDVASGEKIQEWSDQAPGFNPPSGQVVADVAFDRSGKKVLTAYSNGTIKSWMLSP